MSQINDRIADIHTHILPGIDDGADTAEESLKLLLAEQRQGVTDVVLTPHFDMSAISVSSFLEARGTSFDTLRGKMKETGLCGNITLHLGAEVRYDPGLARIDPTDLCIGDTSYLLLEPLNSHPFNFEQTVASLASKGITPILAHIERYPWLTDDEKLLSSLEDCGAVFQCTAGAVLSRRYGKCVKKLLKKGYVHLIASDAHSMERRPPELGPALLKLKKYSNRLIENSARVVSDRLI